MSRQHNIIDMIVSLINTDKRKNSKTDKNKKTLIQCIQKYKTKMQLTSTKAYIYINNCNLKLNSYYIFL